VTSTRCVIAGGGPAGMMLGFLLARAGIDAFRTAIAALVPWVGDRAVQDAVAAANIL
jgi:NADPH-dependent 2,4-dienoyl-CoA reductase/sulfur reductase-like enzyme